MFEHDMKEVKEGRVTVNDIDPTVMTEMLRFIYTGDVSNVAVTQDLLVAADKYNIPLLKFTCESKLVQKVNVDNALEMYTLGETHGANILTEKATTILKM